MEKLKITEQLLIMSEFMNGKQINFAKFKKLKQLELDSTLNIPQYTTATMAIIG